MSLQTSLFDSLADPMARTTDPESSKVAAKTLKVNPREDEILQALKRLVVASDTHAIQAVLGEYGLVRERNTISRRLTSLERKGLVVRCGFVMRPGHPPTTRWRLT